MAENSELFLCTKTEYIWKIENFLSSTNKRTSEAFSAKDCKDVKFVLEQTIKDEMVFLGLRLICETPPVFLFGWKCDIQNVRGEKDGNHKNPLRGHFSTEAKVITFTNGFIPTKCLIGIDDLLPNGTLTLISEVSIVRSMKDVLTIPFEGLYTYLGTGQFSDVTFAVGGKRIKAHKLILSLRCDYFARMFDINMAENKSNIVRIDDFSHNVVKEMLTYIYTNNSPNLKNMAKEMLAIADKYMLKDLKAKAVDVLEESLNVDNAVELFILADVFREAQFKNKSLKCLKENMVTINKTPEWKKMYKEHPDLVTEVLDYMVSK